jgi:CRISPR/Cas system-associated exonuclease Cas4 (RecB family)
MSEYYKSQRTDKYLYKKGDTLPFKLSRSKIDNFIKCPRCFYLDRVLGTSQPPGYPFALNSAVDHLLKLEFDAHRAAGTQHPLIDKYGVDAKPVAHENLDMWRNFREGIQYLHKPTNLYVYGAIDDLWINSNGEYIIVDFKATSKDEEITALDKDWQEGYKRQMEVYQWLLRRNGLSVSKTGYFVYCNGDTDKKAFDGKLEFDVTLIHYVGNDSWVEKTLLEIKKCLDSETIPESSEVCDFCAYFYARKSHEV